MKLGIRYSVLLITLTAMLPVWGSHVFHRLRKITQPDGTSLTIVKCGDENFSYYSTIDKVPIAVNQAGFYCYAQINYDYSVTPGVIHAREKDQRSSSEQSYAQDVKCQTIRFFDECNRFGFFRYPIGNQKKAAIYAQGKIHIPVILVQFDDVKFITGTDGKGYADDVTFFQNHLNASNYTQEDGAGSVRDYFISQSDSIFQPEFDIIGPVTLANKMAHYGASSGGSNDRNRNGMMTEAITMAIDNGFDFSPYAVNGEIPCVAVIYAGEGENVSDDTNTIWPFYSNNLNFHHGNWLFSSALCVNEIADYYGDGLQPDGIGTFCHEFSHALGLPDFYGSDDVFGLDYWDIMDFGQYINLGRTPSGYSAYEKEFMGWQQIPVLATKKGLVMLSSSLQENYAYKLLNEADASGNEYYILENRQESPWFNGGVGHGLLVYHIDFDQNIWTANGVNNNRNHQRMTLIPADGKLVHSRASLAGDPFPGKTGNTRLSDDSFPSDTAYISNYMHRMLTHITETDEGNITFCYMAQGILSTPKNLKVVRNVESTANVSWTEVADAKAYIISLIKDSQTIQNDTITKNKKTYTNLARNGQFIVQVYAIASDYIDSQIATDTIQPYTSGIRHQKENIRPLEIYDLNMHLMPGEKTNTLPSGIYILRQGENVKKIRIR